MSRLDEIKQRCERATEGPWQRDGDLGCDSVRNSEGTELFYVTGVPSDPPYDEYEDRNVELLVNCRDDIPYLLERLRDAEVAISRYNGSIYADDYFAKWRDK